MSGRVLGAVGLLGLVAAVAFTVLQPLARSPPPQRGRSPASSGGASVEPGALGGAPTAAPRVVADAGGFTPRVLALPRGGPGDVVFRRTTDDTCATAVVFPALGIERELPLGQDVTVTVPTTAARTWAFQCGMGMYRSRVVVR